MAKEIERRGSFVEAVRFCAKHKDGATIPMVAEEFSRNQSTVDNWLRRAGDRGLLKVYRPDGGDYEGQQGHVGRPPCIYEITDKGRKFLASEVHPKAAPKIKTEKSKTSKPTKVKTKTVKVPKVKMEKARKAKTDDKAAKLKAKAERDAKVKREKRAAVKASKELALPKNPEAPAEASAG